MSSTETPATHTPGPWGIEQTRDMLWVGPMRDDGHKVDHVVVGLNIDSELTQAAALRQLYNSRLIAAAPDMLAALEAEIEAQRLTDEEVEMIEYHAAHGMDDITGASHCFSAGKRADEAWANAHRLRDAAIAKARGEVA